MLPSYYVTPNDQDDDDGTTSRSLILIQKKKNQYRQYGPRVPLSIEIHKMKYCQHGETFYEVMTRIADHLKDFNDHFHILREILLDARFLPAGRIQAGAGASREVTLCNCYVSRTIEDNMKSIMAAATEAAETLRMGGGIGYDFSSLRPRGDMINSLDSRSSGPISFMDIFNSVCRTISSAGHRRGAQMGVMRVDHPDIELFVRAKHNDTDLTNFNLSVGVTDEFMKAVEKDNAFDLKFEGRVYRTVRARGLWDEIMRSTFAWAEPGILFIDRINQMNNLYYCEKIEATNPCGEVPLPPYGACLLGSFNLVRYVRYVKSKYIFDDAQFKRDIPPVLRAMDNVIDRSVYPLHTQWEEHHSTRRIGIGLTGLANAIETLGFPYASPMFLEKQEHIYQILRDTLYETSIELAIEKGTFSKYDKEKYSQSPFIQTLPSPIQSKIQKHGIRNSHLLSAAPCGTISLCADNVSSGIEPVFSLSYQRTVRSFDSVTEETVNDYAYQKWGTKGKTAMELSPDEHLAVLTMAQKYVDAACSKTINCASSITWDDFRDIYMKAWKNGCKGVTTFRPSGERKGILSVKKENKKEETVVVCTREPGCKTCE